jgi:HEAT repeat protein
VRNKYCMAFILLCPVLSPLSAAQKAPDIHTLFTELKEPGTTNRAAQQIPRVASENSAAREYIAEKLPDMIEKMTLDQVWRNAVRLAGQLKASNSVPALMRVLPRSPFKPSILIGSAMSLDADAVGKALCEIGDPAVPALANLLEHADKTTRWRAARILWNIDSPSSRKVMREDLQHETDPEIKRFTEGKSQQ